MQTLWTWALCTAQHFEMTLCLWHLRSKGGEPESTVCLILLGELETKLLLRQSKFDFTKLWKYLTPESAGRRILTLRMSAAFTIQVFGTQLSIPHWNTIISKPSEPYWVRNVKQSKSQQQVKIRLAKPAIPGQPAK